MEDDTKAKPAPPFARNLAVFILGIIFASGVFYAYSFKEDKIVGTYEGVERNDTIRLSLRKDGTALLYENGKRSRESAASKITWQKHGDLIVLHITDVDGGDGYGWLILKVEEDGSLNLIAKGDSERVLSLEKLE